MDTKISEIQEKVIRSIRELRMQRGISQRSLGDILGISDGQVGNIESPRFKHKYTLKQIYDFCDFVQYPFENLFLTDEELKSNNAIKLLITKIVQYDE